MKLATLPRDVLAGCLWGAFVVAVLRLEWFIPSWLGYPPPQLLASSQGQFLGAHTIIAYMSNALFSWVLLSLAFLFLLVLLRALLRKEWAAAIALAFFLTVFFSGGLDFVSQVEVLIVLGMTVFLLRRLGLLWLVVTFVFASLLGDFPLTTQGSAWYAGISLTGILFMAAMALYGFYTSLGGRPVFGGAVLEE